MTPVFTCPNVITHYRGTSSYDATNDIFVVVQNADNDYSTVYKSSNFFKTKTMIDDQVTEFELVDDFYFYVKKVGQR